MCKPWILQRLDLYMYVDVILFVMCKENHTICNVYINLTQTMLASCFTSCLLEGACLIYVKCVCVCVHSGVQHTWCWVVALFYFVLCTLSCQLLYVVIFVLPFDILLRIVIEDWSVFQIVFGPPRFQPKIIILPVLFDIPA